MFPIYIQICNPPGRNFYTWYEGGVEIYLFLFKHPIGPIAFIKKTTALNYDFRNSGCQLYSFITLLIPLLCFLDFIFPIAKLVLSLLFCTFQGNVLVFFQLFLILSISLVFSNFTVMCLSVVFFVFTLYEHCKPRGCYFHLGRKQSPQSTQGQS